MITEVLQKSRAEKFFYEKRFEVKKIFVLDGDRSFHKYFASLFEEHELLFCGDPKQCVFAAKKFAPDIIIMDINISPQGVELCREIKNDCFLKSVPLIVLSARNSQACKIKALEYGADDYVEKPFSTGELKARIKAVKRSYS